MRESAHNRSGKIGFDQLFGRYVDVDLHVFGPMLCRFLTRLVHDPCANRHDQAGIFGNGDELDRADEAMLGTVPPDQRFEADDTFVDRIDHRLIVQHEFVLLQRGTQRDLELAALLGIAVEHRFVFEMRAAPFVLRAVERQIGAAQKFFHGLAVARSDCRADAGTDIQHMVVDMERGRERGNDRLGQRFCTAAVGCIADHHPELVTSQPPDEFAFVHERLEARGDLRQQTVAHLMAK